MLKLLTPDDKGRAERRHQEYGESSHGGHRRQPRMAAHPLARSFLERRLGGKTEGQMVQVTLDVLP